MEILFIEINHLFLYLFLTYDAAGFGEKLLDFKNFLFQKKMAVKLIFPKG